MTEMTCLSCSATTHNGLVLCELCQYAVRDDLASFPIHFRNLARWKPGRAGSRPVPGSRVLYDGERKSESSDRISRALDETGGEITTWARALADDRGAEVPDADTEVEAVVAVCGWLTGHLTSIGTLEWAGEFVKSVRRAEHRLAALTFTVVPGWQAGECKRRVSMDDICGAPLFVVPGLRWVTCGLCGSTTFARDHLDDIIEDAVDWWARPRGLAETLVALLDTEQSVPRLYERIKKWGQRKEPGTNTPKLESKRAVDVDGRPTGPKSYRFGDVLGLVLDEGATTPEDTQGDSTAVAS